MLLVLGAIHEGERLLARGRAQALDDLLMPLDLAQVTLLEFGPARRFVVEPLAQLGAGSDLLEPEVDARIILATPRGQSRSTSTRNPSPGSGLSYARLILTAMPTSHSPLRCGSNCGRVTSLCVAVAQRPESHSCRRTTPPQWGKACTLAAGIPLRE